MSHEQDSNETKQKESETQRLQLLVAEPQHDILQEGNFQQKYNDFFYNSSACQGGRSCANARMGFTEKFEPGRKV